MALPRATAAPALKLVAEGFTTPLVLLTLPGAKGEYLVADQIGVIHRMKADGSRPETPWLDLRGKLTNLRSNFDERGLLGLALHPKFSASGKFYVYYSAPRRESAPKDWDHTSHLSEFKWKKGAATADAASERVLLEIDEPQFNHNGGRIAFGPDGFLYVAMGDGGGQRDSAENHGPIGNGQNKDVLLGKILRLDVDKKEGGREYAIPRDNPFASGGGRPEIYSYGHRNPWGISFDRGGAHELFEAEVGENMWEEVNIVQRGGNHGWRLREGPAAFDPANPLRPPDETPTRAPDGTPFVEPIITYRNVKGFKDATGIRGASITGGYVYRGKALPALQGKYIFADWSRGFGVPLGFLMVATRPTDGGKTWKLDTLAIEGSETGDVKAFIPALAEDDEGELYVCTSQRNMLSGTTGKIFKLVSAGK
ncbi:MAG: PQQ-dependent sugar dehydrogenase [Verrucomicrobia bacterium]|nr:PQQ-dependent sugar dehydrogenase [Verrucomicrobiota bacterium]